jgi:hypothetical protein
VGKVTKLPTKSTPRDLDGLENICHELGAAIDALWLVHGINDIEADRRERSLGYLVERIDEHREQIDSWWRTGGTGEPVPSGGGGSDDAA